MGKELIESLGDDWNFESIAENWPGEALTEQEWNDASAWCEENMDHGDGDDGEHDGGEQHWEPPTQEQCDMGKAAMDNFEDQEEMPTWDQILPLIPAEM